MQRREAGDTGKVFIEGEDRGAMFEPIEERPIASTVVTLTPLDRAWRKIAAASLYVDKPRGSRMSHRDR